MDVFDLDRTLVRDYAAFARSFTNIKAPDLKESIEVIYAGGRFWPEPLLQLNPHYKPGGSIRDLVRDGTLHEGCAAYFRDPNAVATDDDRTLKLRRHQREAIVKASAGRSFVVTTGTGSGKSLCFFIPIVDAAIRAKQAGDRQRTRAIIVYPMNALANSQLKELEKFLQPVRPPRVERQKMKALDPAETARLLDHFRPTRMFVPVMLAVLCGLRRGEITALCWGGIDLDRAQLSIAESTEQTREGIRQKETKSGRARTVALPALAVEELRRHRTRQAEELLKLGIRLTRETYVYAQPDGTPIQPNSLTHEFVRILGLSKTLPRIRFHDLRHSHATHLLANGVHPKIAQERLGHSSVRITLDLYSHVLPGMQADAAAKVDAALRVAIDRAATEKVAKR